MTTILTPPPGSFNDHSFPSSIKNGHLRAASHRRIPCSGVIQMGGCSISTFVLRVVNRTDRWECGTGTVTRLHLPRHRRDSSDFFDYDVLIARCQVRFLAKNMKNTILMIPYTYCVLFVTRMEMNIPPNSGYFNNAHNFIAANCHFTEVITIIYYNL